MRKITEAEEKQLDHIKRFINKRGLKKGEHFSFIVDKLQLIQGLSTKIVNNTKSIENKKLYENKIEFKDLFKGHENIDFILRIINSIQLTKGCSGEYSGCCDNALNRKSLGTFLSWEAVTEIINGLERKATHTFYSASDPLDWQDKDTLNDYSDIAEYYYDKFGFYPHITTKIPDNEYSIKALKKIWFSQTGKSIRISVTNKNLDRVLKFCTEIYEINKDSSMLYDLLKRKLDINTNDGVQSISVNTFLERDNSDVTNKLYLPLGKDYDYDNNKEINNFTGKKITLIITPDGPLIYKKTEISPFYPEGYKVKKRFDIGITDEDIYNNLMKLIFNNTSYYFFKYEYEGINLLKEYLKNNPSHKLYFKKKFEKLIDTDLYEEVPELFILFNLRK